MFVAVKSWGTLLDKAVKCFWISKQAEAAAPGPNACSWSQEDKDGSCVSQIKLGYHGIYTLLFSDLGRLIFFYDRKSLGWKDWLVDGTNE